MMKRFLISICLIVSSFSLLAGCSSVLEKEKKDTIDVLVPYAGSLVGDSSSVVNIGYILPGGEDVKQVALKTDEHPYGITIEYGLKEKTEKQEEEFKNDWTESNTKKAFLYNAIAYFILVDNVDQVTLHADTESPYSLTVTRADMEQFLGSNLKEYAADAQAWKEEIEEGIINNSDKVNEFYSAHPLQ